MPKNAAEIKRLVDDFLNDLENATSVIAVRHKFTVLTATLLTANKGTNEYALFHRKHFSKKGQQVWNGQKVTETFNYLVRLTKHKILAMLTETLIIGKTSNRRREDVTANSHIAHADIRNLFQTKTKAMVPASRAEENKFYTTLNRLYERFDESDILTEMNAFKDKIEAARVKRLTGLNDHLERHVEDQTQDKGPFKQTVDYATRKLTL